MQLQVDLESTQQELVYRLSEALESRSSESGNHAKRVALISETIASGTDLDLEHIELLKNAAPLHDVGKISTPDMILNKPDKLDQDEWKIMEQHAEKGHSILKGSNHKIIQAGAIIAKNHHENWDGSGYPDGQKGQDIHIFGRIVALADVYDALRHDRCYKEAWDKSETLSFIQEQSGKKFDPELVQVLMNNVDKLEAILTLYPENE